MTYKKLVNKTRIAIKFKLGINHKGNDIFKNFYIYGISEKAPDNEIIKITDFINENFLPYPNNTKIKLKVDYIYIKMIFKIFLFKNHNKLFNYGF